MNGRCNYTMLVFFFGQLIIHMVQLMFLWTCLFITCSFYKMSEIWLQYSIFEKTPKEKNKKQPYLPKTHQNAYTIRLLEFLHNLIYESLLSSVIKAKVKISTKFFAKICHGSWKKLIDLSFCFINPFRVI